MTRVAGCSSNVVDRLNSEVLLRTCRPLSATVRRCVVTSRIEILSIVMAGGGGGGTWSKRSIKVSAFLGRGIPFLVWCELVLRGGRGGTGSGGTTSSVRRARVG